MRRLLLISTSKVHGSGYMDYCADEVSSFLGDTRRLLFVPYALHDRDAYAGMVRERLGKMGITVESIHEAEDPGRAVADAEAVFVGGGNTFRLLHTLYSEDLMVPLRARVQAGLPYMGSSAGSNLACPTIMTTNDMPIVQPPSFEALDAVPFQINPHYLDPEPGSTHMGETRETRIREFHEMNEMVVIGLREGALLRVEGDGMTLKGHKGARIFIRGRDPLEAEPGADLSAYL